MAFVAGALSITVSFQDDDLATSTQQVYVPEGTPIADAHAFAQDYIALIQPLSDCAVRKYNVSQEFYDDTYPTASAGSDVEDKGVITFRTVNNGSATMSWPGVIESILISNISRPGVYIDLTDVAVSALVSALISGAGTPVIEPSNRRGDDLLAVKEAYKQNRRSQKSMGYRG
jgi:hypothetical protein